MQVQACLVDTNILLRLFREADPQFHTVRGALENLDAQGAELYVSLQNMAEFWNVCTRPPVRNGFGLSIAQVEACVDVIEQTMTLLPETDQVYALWHDLVLTHNVRGVQVHDARLAALMKAYSLKHILTLNGSDFERYAWITCLRPTNLV